MRGCRTLSAGLLFSLALYFATLSFSIAQSSPDCSKIVHALSGKAEKFSQLSEVKIMTYNVLNLLENTGRWEFKDGVRVQVTDPTVKPESETREIMNIIAGENPDFAILTEVENRGAAQDPIDYYLNGAYKVLDSPTNDGRGIRIVLLHKKDLPVSIKQRSFTDRKWIDPITGGEDKVFSRDLPVWEVRDPGALPNSKPRLVIVGTHFKSKRNRPGDPESRIARAAQVTEAAKIIQELKTEFGDDVPLVLGGDFNGNLNFEKEFLPLWRHAKLEDSFNVAKVSPRYPDRITHTFHPEDSKTQYSQIDSLMVSQSLQSRVMESRVVPYLDANGRPKAPAKTYEDRKKQPSDHRAVVMKLNLKGLYQ